MSESPLDAWCRWFEHLPPEVADDLAAALAALFPGRALAIAPGARPRDSLIARVRELARGPSETAGVVLTLATLTDAVVADRVDPARWSDTSALLDVLDQTAGEVFGEDQAVGELVEHARLRSPLWARQWKAQHEGWSAVRRRELAQDAVVRWMRRARLAALAPRVD